MKIKKYLPATLITLSILLVVTFVATTVLAKKDDNTICTGIYINSVDVGGMTKEQAAEAVDAYLSSLAAKKLTVGIDEHKVETTLLELGFGTGESKAVEETLKEALNYGKNGNFIKRYKEIKDLENQKMDLVFPVKLDAEKVEAFVEEKCTAFDIAAENATLKRENGEFIVSDDKTGRKVVVDETVGKIMAAVEDSWNYEDITLEAVVMDEQPKYPKEMLELCKDKLGSFSTSYKTSSASRANNLANGARLINGSILFPGEEFSTGGTMGPITAANGYSMAGAYANGKVIDSIGGGVCQVATTLYNAVLLAELEVTERSPHSMIVGYVKPSMDAAIAGDYKDLKFKNNTDAPIYIEAVTVGRTITFTIYGHETRDTENRKVEYVSETLKVIEPGKEKVTEDPTKPTDYRKVIQSAHKGYQAQLWKVVYENGVEVSREKVNYSSYAAEPAYVIVGTMEKEDEEEDKPEDTEKPSKPEKPEKPEDTEKPSKPEKPTDPEEPSEEIPSEGTDEVEE